LELPRLAHVKIRLEDTPSSITWEEKHQPDGPGSKYLVSYLPGDQSFAKGDSDRPICSDDIRIPKIIATVKLELNSLNFPDMCAKETHSCLIKSHFENVTSSALDYSSLGKATLGNARTPLGLKYSKMNQVISKKAIGDEDTSNTSLVDKSACSSYLGGSIDTPNQGDGSRIVSNDTKSLKALATIKLEPNSRMLLDMSTKQIDFRLSCAPSNDVPLGWIVSLQSAEVDDRLNYDLNTVNKQPPIPDPYRNVADVICRNVAKADEKIIYKESTFAPHVALNTVFDNVAIPSTLTLEYRVSDLSFKHLNVDDECIDNLPRVRFSREIDVDQLWWYGYCLFRPLASLHKQGVVHRDVKPGNSYFPV
nr:probable serine/threonine-protein kinase Cdc7 [Tanacetum cinerariifolium]